MYAEGFRAYVDGEWIKAKQLFEETETIKQSVDFPC